MFGKRNERSQLHIIAFGNSRKLAIVIASAIFKILKPEPVPAMEKQDG